MADIKTHTLDLKIGDLHLQADVYTSASGVIYCKDTDAFDLPQNLQLDYQSIIEHLSNMVSNLGAFDSLKIKPVGEE